MKLKVIDLCSGIGGFSYGLEQTGYFETIQFVEIDSFCHQVLKKNFPNVPIYEDIKTYKPVNADVVTAGFPCQPFSVAGKQKGINDNRNLWSETLRVITEAKPKWFIGENVEGIINISNGTVLQQIQKDLEAENFQVQCLVISASGVGAWHQRKRVWIIAYSSSQRPSTQSVGDNRKLEKKVKGKKEARNKSSFRTSPSCSNVSNSNTRLCNGENEEIQTRRTSINNGSTSNSSKSWWQTQSELCGVPNGISYELDKNRTNRIKSLGNSIVPQVIYEIGKAIYKTEKI